MLSNLPFTRSILAVLRNEYVYPAIIPEWLISDKATLVIKDRKNGQKVINFRPIF